MQITIAFVNPILELLQLHKMLEQQYRKLTCLITHIENTDFLTCPPQFLLHRQALQLLKLNQSLLDMSTNKALKQIPY